MKSNISCSSRQENVKYLPGVKLGKNVVADPDLESAGIFIRDLSYIVTFNYFIFSQIINGVYVAVRV